MVSPHTASANPDAPIGAHESAAALLCERRLAALDRSGLLDGEADPAFDRVVRIATALLDAPVGLVSIVTPDRQVFRSHEGLAEPRATEAQTPLSHSFCQHVVARDAPLVVEDAPSHPLVSDNLAIRDLDVIAYCGVPLRAPDGEVLGALCAIDTNARDWMRDDVTRLEELAEILTTELTARLRAASLRRLEAELSDRVTEVTKLTKEMHHRVGNIFAVILSITSLSSRETELSTPEVLERVAGRVRSLSRVHTLNEGADDYHTVDLGALLHAFVSPHAHAHAVTMGGEAVGVPYQLVTPVGLLLHELLSEAKREGALGSLEGHVDLRWSMRNSLLTLRWRAHGKRHGAHGAHAPDGSATRERATTDACSAIVLRLVMQQLEGALERGDLPDGHEWTLTFPIMNTKTCALA